MWIYGKSTELLLYEERKGGRENLKSLLAPSKAKKNVAVSASENNGESYSSVLLGTSEARDVTLQFCHICRYKGGIPERYSAFLSMLKKGDRGLARFPFPLSGDGVEDAFTWNARTIPL
mgnify:CR=1 FL=1